MNVIVVTTDGPLDATPPLWFCDGAGALVQFDGIVRPTESGRPILALDYEVYTPMAEKQLRRLAEELIQQHSLLGMFIEHSRGRVPVAQRSFRLRIASPHRAEALLATQQFIDRLKQDVPIWKSPVFTGTADEHR